MSCNFLLSEIPSPVEGTIVDGTIVDGAIVDGVIGLMLLVGLNSLHCCDIACIPHSSLIDVNDE